MSTILALLSLALMALSSYFSDGTARYFDVSSKKGIAPYSITFSSKDLKQAKAGEKFIWSFGDGETLTTTNTSVSHIYLNAGTFTANLKYLKKSTDAISKAVDGGSVKIVISPKPNILPVADFSCVPSPTSNVLDCNASGSTDSDGTIANYNYEWGDGTNSLSSTSNSISHTYSSSGEKSVKLTVTDNKGGTSFVEKKFLLKPNTAPVANFTCTKNGILKIHCESTSSDAEEALSNLEWSLDDGTTYSGASFDHTFNKRPTDVAVGSHLVTLVATDSLGLTGSLAKNVDVELEVPTILPRAYFKVFMEDTAVNLHTFITKTQFDIKRAYYTVYGAGPTPLQTIELSDLEYANNVTKVNLGAYGNYRIALTVIDMRDQVLVTGRPFNLTENTNELNPYVVFRAGQSAVRTLYLNLNPSFDFDEQYSIKEFFVDMGDGVQKHLVNETALTYTYATAGTYTLTVRAVTNHGTEATATGTVTVTNSDVAIVRPDPTFSYRIYDFAQNINFYDEKSSTPNGEIISYFWDFGDGTTGTGQALAHFYSAGTYIVSLTVTDTAGMTSTQKQKITIQANGDDLAVVINCNLRPPYLDQEQLCKVVALDKLNDISRIRVVWGDGTAVNLTTPAIAEQGVYFATKKFAGPGTYAIKVLVTTNRGVSKGWASFVNIVARPPVASLNCYSNNLAVYCDALGSYDVKGTALTYIFDFGNGVVETNSTGVISYAYPAAGLYNVSVNVTDATGLSGLATTQVQAVKAPNILPNADFLCESTAPLTIYCWDNGIYDQDGTVTISKLNFDDGNYDFLNPFQTTRHQFTTGGEHEITLTVIDNDGGVTTKTKTFGVLPNSNPVASMECTSNSPQEISCYSTSTESDPADSIVGYGWEFGDGGIQNGLAGAFVHTYSDSVEKLVKLTIHDQYGGSATIEKNVKPKVNLAPVANIDCQNSGLQTVTCVNFSYDPDGQIVNYTWEFDDNTTASGHQVTHTFVAGEVHNIKAVMTDNLGAKTSIVKEVHILFNQLPSFAIFADNLNGVVPLEVNFKSLNAIDSDGSIISYKWIFGDGSVSDQEEVAHTFTNTGSYNVKLQITDNHGGMTEKSVTIIASKASNLIINTDSDNGVANFNVHFNASNSSDPEGEIEKFEWYYQGQKIAEGAEIDYEFDIAGEHYIELTATNSLGFQTKASKTITALTPPIYLDGKIENNAFVNREYQASLDLVLEAGVAPENISYELQNAPVGVSFNEETKQLTWTPTSGDVGEVTFYLNVSDGVLNHRRTFKVSVFELTQVASLSTSSGGGTYKIQAPESLLDNAYVTLPSSVGAYSINFFQATIGDRIILKAEPSIYLESPLTINFDKEMYATQTIDQMDHSLGDFFKEVAGGIEKISRAIKIHIACPSDLVDLELNKDSYQNNFQWDSIEESLGVDNYGASLGTNKVRILKTLRGNKYREKIINMLEHIKASGSDFRYIEIYLVDNSIPKVGKSPGAHSEGDKQVFYLNIDNLYSTELSEYKKFTLRHEHFHVLQARALGCVPSLLNKRQSYNGIYEGSADHSAFLDLTLEEQKNMANLIYSKEIILSPYEIGNSVLAKGLFGDGKVSDKLSYKTRILWDYFNIDKLSFFSILGYELRSQVFLPFFNKDNIDRMLLEKLNLLSAGGNISDSMLDMTDGVNNFNSTKLVNSNLKPPLTSILKNTSIVAGWMDDRINNNNFIKSEEILIRDDVMEINLKNIFPMSGISISFNLEDLISKLSYVYPENQLTVEVISENPDIKIRARSVATVGSALNFIKNSGKETSANYSMANNISGRVIINLVNSGLISETNVKLRIHFLKSSFNLLICNAGYPIDILNFYIPKIGSFSLNHYCDDFSQCICECKNIPNVKVGQSFDVSVTGTEIVPEGFVRTPIKPLPQGAKLVVTEDMAQVAYASGAAVQYYTVINDYTPPSRQEFIVFQGTLVGARCAKRVISDP